MHSYNIILVRVQVSERDWQMTFQPQFKACVKAGSRNLMCSYNRYAVKLFNYECACYCTIKTIGHVSLMLLRMCVCTFSINGIPACANKRLLTDILKTEWGFTGIVDLFCMYGVSEL